MKLITYGPINLQVGERIPLPAQESPAPKLKSTSTMPKVQEYLRRIGAVPAMTTDEAIDAALKKVAGMTGAEVCALINAQAPAPAQELKEGALVRFSDDGVKWSHGVYDYGGMFEGFHHSKDGKYPLWKFARLSIPTELAQHEGAGKRKPKPCDYAELERQSYESKVGEWIKWEGGPMPVPADTKVIVKFRDQSVVEDDIQRADFWVWRHSREDDDVIAYRLVKDQPC